MPRRCARTARRGGGIPGPADSVPAADHRSTSTPAIAPRHRARWSSTRRSAGWRRASAKRAESTAARDARVDARIQALASETSARRRGAASSQQASLVLKREVARLSAMSGARRWRPEHSCRGRFGNRPSRSRRRSTPTNTWRSRIASADRATSIRARLESYLPFFDGRPDVLDVGCGRGEFLELLAAARHRGARHRSESRDGRDLPGARARRDRGGRGRATCRRCPTARSAACSRRRSSSTCSRRICWRSWSWRSTSCGPAARIVLETLNPACWVAFFESYIRDITHVWPLHPETLQFLVVASGFTPRRYRVPLAGRRQRQAAAGHRHGGDRPGPRRPGRFVQHQRREVEQPDVHLPGLRDHRSAVTAFRPSALSSQRQLLAPNS